MDFISIILLSGSALFGPPDQDIWSFAASSSGENYIWMSPTPIAADGGHYEMLYTISAATVMVEYVGITFGPIDVTDMIPEAEHEVWRSSPGPAPLDFGWIEVITPKGQDPPSLAYDWIVELNEKGFVKFRMENLFLGQSEYDLGWPWGSVTVDILSGTIYNDLSISSVPPPCYADITNDGIVDVSDLLEVIGAWGYCFECPADINQDSLVDVTDLLEMVAAWGSCPR
jgi:hypothetical protein